MTCFQRSKEDWQLPFSPQRPSLDLLVSLRIPSLPQHHSGSFQRDGSVFSDIALFLFLFLALYGVGPISGGFLGISGGWRWVQGFLALFSGVLTVAAFLFGEQTLDNVYILLLSLILLLSRPPVVCVIAFMRLEPNV